MRPIIAALACLIASSGLAQAPGNGIASIQEVPPKGAPLPVAASGIIDTRSALEVSVKSADIYREFATTAQKESVRDSLAQAADLIDLADRSQQRLQEATQLIKAQTRFTPENSQAITQKLLSIVVQFRAIKSDSLKQRFNRALSLAIQANSVRGEEGEDIIVVQVSALIQEARDASNDILAKLDQASLKVSLRSRLERDSDVSRRPGVRLLEPLSPEDQLVLARLRERFGSNGNFDALLKTLANEGKAIVTKSLEETNARFDALINANLQKLSDLLRTIESESATAQAWKLVLDDAKAFQAELEATQAGVKEALKQARLLSTEGTSVELEARYNAFLSATSGTYQRVRNLESQGKKLKTDIDAALRTNAKEDIKRALAQLEQFFDAGLTSLKEFAQFEIKNLDGVLRNLLETYGLARKLNQIGEVFTGAKDGKIRLDNEGERLAGLPKSQSGDELIINLQVNGLGGDGGTDLPSTRLYLYKLGFDTARLISIAFFDKENGSGYRYGAVVADVIKRYSRKSLRANREGSFGFGTSLAFLDQDADDQQEFGLGIAASALDDRLIIGYGFNLALKRPYHFIGYRIPVRL